MKRIGACLLSGLIWSAIAINTVQAQIIPDGTLGGEQSSIVPRSSGGDQITGGAIRGSNLFHSFSNFNIGTGQQLYFANPTGVQNILTRVTGSSISSINGTLGVDGSANLFLLNPNGIVFGQNARLDVRGSFLATTANAIDFGNQGSFSATNPQAPPLLMVQPSALTFTQIQGGEIVNRSQADNRTGLSVPTGKSLLLVGGNVISDGGNITVPGGRVELGGLSEPGTIALTNQSDRWQLGFPTGVQRSNIILQNQGSILITGGLDDIVLTGRNITVTDAPLLPVLLSGVGTSERRSGDLILNATGNVSVDYSNTQGSRLGNAIVEDVGIRQITAENIFLKRTSIGGITSRGGTLNASDLIVLDGSSIQAGRDPQTGKTTGNINITARNLNLTNGSRVFTGGIATTGDGGKVSLNVLDTLLVTGESLIGTGGTSSGETLIGKSGDIEIQTRALVLEGRNNLILTFSDGTRAGDMQIKADTITVNGGMIGSISSGTANSGNINIQSRFLFVTNGGTITTSSSGTGNSGDLTIDASDAIEVKGAFESFYSYLSTSSFGAGSAGQLTLNTRRLSVAEGGVVASSVLNGTRGGMLTINASELVDVYGETENGQVTSFISARALGLGDAGSITIDTGRLRIRDGAFITTSNVRSDSNARSGNILIRARNGIEISGRARDGQTFSRISSNTASSGRAGNIDIQGESLQLVDSAIFSNTSGRGQGGNVRINVGSLSLAASIIFAGTQGEGDSGNVEIAARDRVSLSGVDRDGIFSQIATSSTSDSTGKAGNLTLSADSVQLTDRATLSARTRNDNSGGNITVNANTIELTGGGLIQSSTSGGGQAGNIILTARDRINFEGNYQSQVDSGSGVAAISTGSGSAGNIFINAPLLRLSDDAVISARSSAADGGSITINASEALVLRRNSRISTTAGEEQALGNGGNITINAGSIVSKSDENTTIQANAFTGRGGNVTISANALFGLTPSDVLIPGQSTITASSQLGVQGQVTIAQPQTQPTQGTIELPTTILDASNQLTQICPRNLEIAKAGKFVVSGAGSLPPNPISPLAGSIVTSPLASLETLPNRSTVGATLKALPSAVVEAQGWIRKRDGTVELIALTPETTPPIVAACPSQTVAVRDREVNQ